LLPGLPPPSSPIRYTAIGDSLTVGMGASFLSPGFVERFAQKVGETRSQLVTVNKFARVGASSGEILFHAQDPPIAYHLQQADLVTLTSGGIDLIDAGKAFLKSQDMRVIYEAIQRSTFNNLRLMTYIRELQATHFTNSDIWILNMYNPFPTIPETDHWIRAYNYNLSQAAQSAKVRVADIYHAFLGRTPYLLSRDGIHPNDAGYEVIANVLFSGTLHFPI
jgi:lysophospholipase L1-like esterase